MFTLTKNTLCTLALFTLMHCAPLHAQYDDTELRNRVSALESRVDALEGHSPSVELRDIDLTVDYGQSYLVLPSQLFDGDAVITAVDDAELRAGSVVAIAAETESFTYHVGSQSATVTINRSGIPHEGDPRHDEHMALHATVVDRQAATVVAVKDGKWHDPTIWNTSFIPSDGDKVLIHETIDVLYDAHSDALLDWVRVDGGLSFSGGNRLVVETLVGTSGSRLNIGSAESPIPDDAPVEIVIDTAGGPLDMEADPTLLSRGVIVHGDTRIYGEEKTAHMPLEVDGLEGDVHLQLSDVPINWHVGDQVIVASTEGDTDEFRVIESIDGQTVSLTEPLTHDHTRPSGEYFTADELDIHVANITRSVKFRTTNTNAPPQERAHFMVMHSSNTVLRNYSVEGYGRTDKSKLIDDVPGNSINGEESFGTNPRGRYSIHLHRTGTKSNPILVHGCVVIGSPGWGIVHHDSAAILSNNIVYDAFGSCFVQESDIHNTIETGVWKNNLAIRALAGGHNDFGHRQFRGGVGGRNDLFDMAFFGTGYWLQGGGIGLTLENNKACNVNIGLDVFSTTFGLGERVEKTYTVGRLKDSGINPDFISHLESRGYDDSHKIRTHFVPPAPVYGMEVYNAKKGTKIWLLNKRGAFKAKVHNVYAHIDEYKFWNVKQGINNFYVTQVRFGTGLLVGDLESPDGAGFTTNSPESNSIEWGTLRVEGFEYALRIPVANDGNELFPELVSKLDTGKFANVQQVFRPIHFHDPFSKLFEVNSVEAQTIDTADKPTASFVVENGILDASSSVGHGYVNRTGSGNGIAAYKWNVNGDQMFGEFIKLEPGQYDIELTVWDSLGQTDSTADSIVL